MDKLIAQARDMRALLDITAKHDVRALALDAALLSPSSYTDKAIAHLDQVARFDRRTKFRLVDFRRDVNAPPR